MKSPFKLSNMDVTTLEKANSLHRKIEECSNVLNWLLNKSKDIDDGSTDTQIIIVFDGIYSNEQIRIDSCISNEIIEDLKSKIHYLREKYVLEFIAL